MNVRHIRFAIIDLSQLLIVVYPQYWILIIVVAVFADNFKEMSLREIRFRYKLLNAELDSHPKVKPAIDSYVRKMKSKKHNPFF